MSKTAIAINIQIGHTARVLSQLTNEGYTHEWTVFVQGLKNQDITCFISKIVFYLHESFKKPRRTLKSPPFTLKEKGYGGFNLPIEIYFKSDETRKTRLEYDLFLQDISGMPINHIRTERITFFRPVEDFKKKLLSAGGVIVETEADLVCPPGSDKSSSGIQLSTTSSKSSSDSVSAVNNKQLSPASVGATKSDTSTTTGGIEENSCSRVPMGKRKTADMPSAASSSVSSNKNKVGFECNPDGVVGDNVAAAGGGGCEGVFRLSMLVHEVHAFTHFNEVFEAATWLESAALLHMWAENMVDSVVNRRKVLKLMVVKHKFDNVLRYIAGVAPLRIEEFADEVVPVDDAITKKAVQEARKKVQAVKAFFGTSASSFIKEAVIDLEPGKDDAKPGPNDKEHRPGSREDSARHNKGLECSKDDANHEEKVKEERPLKEEKDAKQAKKDDDEDDKMNKKVKDAKQAKKDDDDKMNKRVKDAKQAKKDDDDDEKMNKRVKNIDSKEERENTEADSVINSCPSSVSVIKNLEECNDDQKCGSEMKVKTECMKKPMKPPASSFNDGKGRVRKTSGDNNVKKNKGKLRPRSLSEPPKKPNFLVNQGTAKSSEKKEEIGSNLVIKNEGTKIELSMNNGDLKSGKKKSSEKKDPEKGTSLEGTQTENICSIPELDIDTTEQSARVQVDRDPNILTGQPEQPSTVDKPKGSVSKDSPKPGAVTPSEKKVSLQKVKSGQTALAKGSAVGEDVPKPSTFADLFGEIILTNQDRTVKTKASTSSGATSKTPTTSKTSDSSKEKSSSSSSSKDKSSKSSKSSSSSEHRHHSRDDKKDKSRSSSSKDGDKKSSDKKSKSDSHKSSSKDVSKSEKEESRKKSSSGDHKDKKDDKHHRHHSKDKSESKRESSSKHEKKSEASKEKKESSSKGSSSSSESTGHVARKTVHEEESSKREVKTPSNDVAAPTPSKSHKDKKDKHKDKKRDKSKSKDRDSGSHKKDSSHRHHSKDKSSSSDSKKESRSSSKSSSKHKSSDASSASSKNEKGSSSSRVSSPTCVSPLVPILAPTSLPVQSHSSNTLHPVTASSHNSSVSPHVHLSSKSPSSSHVPSGSLPSSPSPAKDDSSSSHRHKSSKSSKKRKLSPTKSSTSGGGGSSHHSRSDSQSPAPKRSPNYYHRQLQQKASLPSASPSASPASRTSLPPPTAPVAAAVTKLAASPRIASPRNVASPRMVAQAPSLPSSSPRIALSPRDVAPVVEVSPTSSHKDRKRKRKSYQVSVASPPSVTPTPAPHAPCPSPQVVPPVRISKKRKSRSSSSSSSNSSRSRSRSPSVSSSISMSRSRSKSVSRSRSRSSSSARSRSASPSRSRSRSRSRSPSSNAQSKSGSVSRSPSPPPSRSPRRRSRSVSSSSSESPSPHRNSNVPSNLPGPRHKTLGKLLDQVSSTSDSEDLDIPVQTPSKRAKMEVKTESKKDVKVKREHAKRESRVKSEQSYPKQEIKKSTSSSPESKYAACIANAIGGVTSATPATASRGAVVSPNGSEHQFNPVSDASRNSERLETSRERVEETLPQRTNDNHPNEAAAEEEEEENDDSEESENSDDDSDDDEEEEDENEGKDQAQEVGSDSSDAASEEDEEEEEEEDEEEDDEEEEEELEQSVTETPVTASEEARPQSTSILRRIGRDLSKEEEERLKKEARDFLKAAKITDLSRLTDEDGWIMIDAVLWHVYRAVGYPSNIAVEVQGACVRLREAGEREALDEILAYAYQQEVIPPGCLDITWNDMDADFLSAVRQILVNHDAHLFEC